MQKNKDLTQNNLYEVNNNTCHNLGSQEAAVLDISLPLPSPMQITL
jgi:hypothetical protein